MRPSPRRVPKTASMGNRTSTRPKRSRTHPSLPPQRRCPATAPASLPTTSRRNSSSRWRISNTCSSNSSSKASAGNTRCHHNRECPTSNNHQDRWIAAGKTTRVGNDGDDMRDETENFVLDTRTHTLLIHQKKAPLWSCCASFWLGVSGGGRRLQSFITSSNPVFMAFGGRGPPSDSWTRPVRQRNLCCCVFPSSDDDVRLFGQPGTKGRKRGFAEGRELLLEGGNFGQRNPTVLAGACLCLRLRGPTGPAAVAEPVRLVVHHTCRASIWFPPLLVQAW